MMTRAAVFVLTAFVFASSACADAPKLGLPITCELGKTCWVQQYVDHDPSGAAKDYACGTQTYDGHDGTDIRVRDITSPADVIASAGGTVKAVRDGVADHLIRSDADRAAVTDRECGNGVLISHEGGWETQYCHMRQSSIAVKAGDAVSAGQKLGAVGYSGMAEFPHVHLTVREGNRAVDPFRGGKDGTQCGQPDNPLWTKDALLALAYRKSDILALSFAPGAVEMEQLEEGRVAAVPSRDWPAMVAYVWVINLEKGDRVNILFEGPQGIVAENGVTLERAKAQYLLFAGKKRPASGWPKGVYRVRVDVSNAEKTRLEKGWHITID